MDPVSVVSLIAACAQIAGLTTNILSGVRNLQSRYNNVEVYVDQLVIQIRSIRTGTRRISRWLGDSTQRLSRDERETLRDILVACESLMRSMSEEMERDIDNARRDALRNRAKHLWRQARINEYRESLSYQIDALTFLLQCLQLENARDRQLRLQSEEGRNIVAQAQDSSSSISASDASSSGLSLELTADNLSALGRDQQPARRRRDKRRAGQVPPVPVEEKNAAPGDDTESIISLVESAVASLEGLRLDSTSPTSDSSISTVTRQGFNGVENILTRLNDLRQMLLNGSQRLSLAQLSTLAQELVAEVEAISGVTNVGPPDRQDIWAAAKNGDGATIEQMLRGGHDINSRNVQGQSLLHIAALESHLELVQLLIHSEIDINARDNDGTSVVQAICSKPTLEKVQILKHLLEAGAPTGATGSQETPLHMIVQTKRLDALEFLDLLLMHGANVNARTGPFQRSVLHYACAKMCIRRAEVVQRLLDAGAAIRARSTTGFEPLDDALKTFSNDEQSFAELNVPNEFLMSRLYTPCRRFREGIKVITILVKRLPVLQLNITSRNFVRRSYLFRGFTNFSELPITDARIHLREALIQTMLMSDVELYRAVTGTDG